MKNISWYKVLDNKEELIENRVMTVTAGHKGICLTHFEDEYCALDNKCPHQGGPLGEGSIENGLLRCPWHGWDYHPCTGKAPGFDDGVEKYSLKIDGDAVYVGLEEETPHKATITDIMVETMVNWGVNRVFGMVGHSNLGLADALRRQEEKGNLKFFGIRHEGAAALLLLPMVNLPASLPLVLPLPVRARLICLPASGMQKLIGRQYWHLPGKWLPRWLAPAIFRKWIWYGPLIP